MSWAPGRAQRLMVAAVLPLAISCQPSEPGSIDPLRVGAVYHLDFTNTQPALCSRKFTLQAGEYLHLEVEQVGVDVELIVRRASEELLRVDSPTGQKGLEHLHLIAEEPGTYRFEARVLTTTRGARAALRVVARRPPTAVDAQRAAATLAESKGRRLTATATPKERLLAARHFLIAAGQWAKAGDTLFAARAHFESGRLLFENLPRDEHSFDSLRVAARRLETASQLAEESGDQPLTADALIHLGKVAKEMGLLTTARDAFEMAIEINRTWKRRKAQATAMNELALIAAQNGELFRALELYNDATATLEDLDYPCVLATVKANLGRLLSRLGTPQRARDELRGAFSALERGACSDSLRSNLEIRLGDIFLALDRPHRSLELYGKALERYRERSDVLGEALALNSLAHGWIDAGRFREALNAYREAGIIYRQAGRERAWATAWRGTCRMRERLEEFISAESCYEQILEHAAHAQPEVLASARFGLARLARRTGDTERARIEIDAALASLEELWDDLGGLAAPFRASKRGYYEFRIELLADAHRREPEKGHDAEAFVTSERARAQSFLEALRPSRAEPIQALDTAEKMEKLRAQINALDLRREGRRPGEDATEEMKLEVEAALRNRLAQHSRLEESLRRVDPRNDEIGRRRPPLDLETVRRSILDDETLLLQYHLGEDRSHLWAVSRREKLFTSQLPKRQTLERTARRTRRRLENGGPIADAAELGHMVLDPVANLLERYPRLLIVADGALLEFPFAALPRPGPHPVPLASTHEIVYAPSTSVLATIRARHRQSPDGERLSFLGLGDAVFQPFDPRLEISPPNAAHRKSPFELARLPGSRDELEAVRRHFSPAAVRVLYGFDVRREVFESDLARRARVIHIASHSLVNDLHPELSAVVLSLFDALGQRLDGHLRSYEIATFELTADLVVLSACETGRHPIQRGDGVAGLARGFFTAGADRLLVSLWKVEDEATARLMGLFYSFWIHDRLSPPRALQKAQLALYQDNHGPWSSPYYWAGFVLQGEPGP